MWYMLMTQRNCASLLYFFQNKLHKQNGGHYKFIVFNEKFHILIQISFKFVPKIQIDNKAALIQVRA